MKISKAQGILLTIVLSLAFLCIFHFKIIQHPNKFLFAAGDTDCVTNYYNFMYHARWDTTVTEFKGVAYPFGDLAVMVDCIPLLSSIMQKAVEWHLFSPKYLVAFLNVFMLLSLVIAAVFLFLILEKHRVPVLLASIAAVGISALSSQYLLWEYGHYALTFSFFFPAGWFLLIDFKNAKRPYLYSIEIGFFILCCLFLHVYLGLILLFFAGFSYLFCFFRTIKDIKNHIHEYVQWAIQLLLPVIIFTGLIALTDHHAERFEMPYMVIHRASIRSIFTPIHSIFTNVYHQIFCINEASDLTWRAIGNFIGTTSVIMIFVCLGTMIYRFFIRKGEKFTPQSLQAVYRKKFMPYDIEPFFFAATVLVFYACAVPIRYRFAFVLEPFPFFKQIIALGRFAWAFYYVVAVWAVCMLNIYFYKKWKWICYLGTVLFLFEAGQNHYYLSKKITESPNLFEQKHEFYESELDINNYQAIVPLPFIYLYSSFGEYVPNREGRISSYILSYQSGIPMCSAILSRPPMEEQRTIMKLFSDEQAKDYLKICPNIKPFLIIFAKKSATENDKKLLSKSNILFETVDFIYASYYPTTK